jgi:uncharacterized membrane protein
MADRHSIQSQSESEDINDSINNLFSDDGNNTGVNDRENENNILKDLDNQFKEKIETGDKVSDKIAEITNRAFRAAPDEN